MPLPREETTPPVMNMNFVRDTSEPPSALKRYPREATGIAYS